MSSTTTPPALPILCICEACQGAGELICSHCRGNGTRFPDRPGGGRCPRCGGGGTLDCMPCEGTGEVLESEAT